MWFRKLFGLKVPALIISALLMLIGFLAMALGLFRTYEAGRLLIGLDEGKPGVALIEAVDTYLFALVILILGGGVYKLFAGDENTFSNNPVLSTIKSFSGLKTLLWEALLLTLTVWCSLEFFITDAKDLHVEQLIIPGSILLLAFALKLIKGSAKH